VVGVVAVVGVGVVAVVAVVGVVGGVGGGGGGLGAVGATRASEGLPTTVTSDAGARGEVRAETNTSCRSVVCGLNRMLTTQVSPWRSRTFVQPSPDTEKSLRGEDEMSVRRPMITSTIVRSYGAA
jgi:hypothetical protein